MVLLVDGTPVFGIILEAQLQIDRAKPFTWPMYAVSARARFKCPFVVLVVTPDTATARWATEAVDVGGGFVWKPFVVGPDGVPVITDPARAAREPQLAVLSVMAHGRADDIKTAVAVASAAAAGIAALPDALRMLCLALIESSLGDAARKSFEMLPQGQQFFSETMRTSFAQGEAQGEAKGEAKGEARGEAKGEAKALLRVLERRGLAISTDQCERILGCTDIATLEGWLDKAVTASNSDELFV